MRAEYFFKQAKSILTKQAEGLDWVMNPDGTPKGFNYNNNFYDLSKLPTDTGKAGDTAMGAVKNKPELWVYRNASGQFYLLGGAKVTQK